MEKKLENATEDFRTTNTRPLPNQKYIARLLQTTPSGTLFISIPKTYVKKYGLHKGETILFVELEDGTLKLYPSALFTVNTVTTIQRKPQPKWSVQK